MSAARALLAAALLAGCAEIVGVRDLPGDGDAGDAQPGDAPNDSPLGDAPSCTGARVVMITSVPTDTVAVAGGFGFAQLTGAGVARCPSTGTCANAQNILGFGAAQDFEQAAAGTRIAYTLARTDGTSTSVHLAALDGSGDQTLLTKPGPADATYVAFSGSRLFWTDSSAGETHCIGCTGQDTVWMTTSGIPQALLADANAVYVLAGDDLVPGQLAVYSCATSGPCATTTRVTGDLAPSTSGAKLASDGTKLYVAVVGQPYVAAYNTINETDMTTEGAQAIAVDATTGDLFYAANDGTLAKVKTDGLKTKTALTGCPLGNDIASLAFDATDVYALVPDAGAGVVYAVPRK